MANAACQPALDVEISSDGVYVTLKADASNEQGLDPAELIAHLRALGVAVKDPASIEALAGPDLRIHPTKNLILIEGRPPKPEQPATLELLVQPPDPDACDSYYERTNYLTAKPGQPIAKIHPAVPGEDGEDVFGNPIKHKKARAPEFNFIDNIQLDPDGLTVRATAVGRICRKGDRLWVNTALEIPGDVDFAVCNVNVSGDVDIKGSVLDLFKVKGSSIYVGGAIEAAEITAAVDIHVRGGIVAKGKGHCVAAGDITAKHVSSATLTAGGNVSSYREIVNSRIICGGRLTVERGPLTSGHVTAVGGVQCRSLGSSTCDDLLVEVGFDETLRLNAAAKFAEINRRRQQATKLRAAVAQLPLHQQTGVLIEADEIDHDADEILTSLRDACLASRQACVAEVSIRDLLYAGVTIRFPNVEATIDTTWKGPMRIVPNKEGDDWQICMIDARDNSMHPLTSRPWADPALKAIERTFPA
jgi:uncharacterized protein (DUF342 family)